MHTPPPPAHRPRRPANRAPRACPSEPDWPHPREATDLNQGKPREAHDLNQGNGTGQGRPRASTKASQGRPKTSTKARPRAKPTGQPGRKGRLDQPTAWRTHRHGGAGQTHKPGEATPLQPAARCHSSRMRRHGPKDQKRGEDLKQLDTDPPRMGSEEGSEATETSSSPQHPRSEATETSELQTNPLPTGQEMCMREWVGGFVLRQTLESEWRHGCLRCIMRPAPPDTTPSGRL